MITSAAIPMKIIANVTKSGNFGKLFNTNLRCGCNKTKTTQNTAKYSMKGVKIASAIAIANKKEYIGFGRFSP